MTVSGDFDQEDTQTTIAGVKASLERVEYQLAKKLGINPRIVRRELVSRSRQGLLPYNEQTDLWHELHDRYVSWLREIELES